MRILEGNVPWWDGRARKDRPDATVRNDVNVPWAAPNRGHRARRWRLVAGSRCSRWWASPPTRPRLPGGAGGGDRIR